MGNSPDDRDSASNPGRIDLPHPPGAGRRSATRSVWTVLIVCVGLVALLAVGGRLNGFTDWHGAIVSGIVLAVVVVSVLANIRATRRAEATSFYLDDSGIHKSPGFDIIWSQVVAIRITPAFTPGTHILHIRTEPGIRDQFWAFDAAAADDDAILALGASHGVRLPALQDENSEPAGS